MADKLSWTELRRALASRAGVSEKTAGLFLSAFTTQLVEGLKADKQVKINGLGTFKLQAVAPRKSVNVSTGEEIVIAGYNKIVFAPEAGVKELVEKTISSPRSDDSAADNAVHAAEIDPLKKLGEQAVEIVDLLADLGQKPRNVQSDNVQGTKEEAEPVEEAKPVGEAEPVEEPKAVEEAEAVEEPETVEEPKAVIEAEPVVEPEAVGEPEAVIEAEKPRKKYHFLRDVLICVAVLLMLLFGGYFFLRNQLSNWMEQISQEKVQSDNVQSQEKVQSDNVQGTKEEETATLEITEDVQSDYVQSTKEETESIEEEPYAELITIEPMHEASRLTWMSKRYYGDKKYWPYLYDANRDQIRNPSQITVGTPIRVPKLTKEQLDTTNARTKANLERLRIEAEEACRRK